MVYVDFSNPFLRGYLASGYLKDHESYLLNARAEINTAVHHPDSKENVKPLAAVLDIDEVVLANIHMNTYSAEGSPSFYACDYYRTPEGRPWPRDDTRLNPLLPGAKLLIATLLVNKVEVFFITGRAESLRNETVENFVYVGLADDSTSSDKLPVLCAKRLSDPSSGMLVMCPDAELPSAGKSIRQFKEAKRAAIAETHRIIMNIGDQVSDLGFYGERQILTPHPFYRTA
jgi:predicted secreted acid phosphatase